MSIDVRLLAGVAGAWLTAVAAAPAVAVFDPVPAPGAPPIHLRIALTAAAADGPQSTTADIVLRRTGPATVALQRGTDVVPLVIDAAGSLHADVAAAAADVAGVLAALNMAHGVTGVPGAGSRDGWSALVPLPPPDVVPPPAPAVSPSPAGPLVIPIHIFGADAVRYQLDGSADTTLAAGPLAGAQRPARSHGGGFGGFGGYGGGRGGFGGEHGGEDGGYGRRFAAPPVTLDVHVSGRVERGALAHLTIVQTRRVDLDGLPYTNVASATIDVVR